MTSIELSMATGPQAEAGARVTATSAGTASGEPKAAPTAGGVAAPGVLRGAMLALAEVLADLEIDLGNTLRAAKRSNSPRQRRGLMNLAARYEAQLNRLRVFFDWDVYHDRAPSHSEAA